MDDSKYVPPVLCLLAAATLGYLRFREEPISHSRILRDKIEITVPQDDRREKDGDNIVKRLYEFIGGEDRVIDLKERRTALDGLGFEGFVFDDSEPIKFSLTKAGDKINIHMGSGNFDRYVGTVDLERVRKYLDEPKKR